MTLLDRTADTRLEFTLASAVMGHWSTCPPPLPGACVRIPIWQFIYPVGSGRLAENTTHFHVPATDSQSFNPLECKGNYSATLNNMKLVHWPLMGVLLHLVQRGRARAVPYQSSYSRSPLLCGFNVSCIKGLSINLCDFCLIS